MLTHLYIKHYALIDTLDLELYPGLNTITGETGAGKSILLGALGLILGQRADATAIQQGESQCVVEGRFSIGDYGLQPFFAENDLEYADEVIIRRVVSDNGKSRAYVNELPVNLQTLKALVGQLVDIHSQHATLLLQDAQFQLRVLDAYAGIQEQVEAYTTLYRQWSNAKRQLEQLVATMRTAQEERDYNEFQFIELRDAKLKGDELEELETLRKRLANAHELGEAYTKALSLLQGDDENGALPAIHASIASLNRIGALDPRASTLGERLGSVRIELQDIRSELESCLETLEVDPSELARIEERLGLIYHLREKHHCSTVAELLARQDELEAKLELTDSYETQCKMLEEEVESLGQQLTLQADVLHSKRSQASSPLSERVQSMLKQMGIANATFEVEVLAQAELQPNGRDTVAFLYSGNMQVSPQPLARVASGGELSRVMLSLKGIMAESVAMPTIIFDEIDTGVSGNIAALMGQLISQMGHRMQVLNITHLPQIAAQPGHHFQVYKTHTPTGTQTKIRLLTPEERVGEIAKLLSGENVTEASLANARELLGAKETYHG